MDSQPFYDITQPKQQAEPFYDITELSTEDKNNVGNQTIQKVTGNSNIEYQDATDEQELGDVVRDSALKGLNFVVDALDYLGNMSRTAIRAGIKGEDVFKHIGEAATYKRRTTAAQLKHSMGIKDVSFEKGKFDVGDVADFLGEFALDVVTDPLTIVSLGTSKLAKTAAIKARNADAILGNKELVKKLSPKQLEQAKAAIKEGADKADDVTLIEKAIQQGALKQTDVNKMADRSIAAGTLKQQGIESAYGAGMGGMYYASSQVDDDTTPIDFMKDFALGAGATVGVRAFYKAKGKEVLAGIGDKINRIAGPREAVRQNVKYFDVQEGKMKWDTIKSDVPSYKYVELAGDASHKANVLGSQIENIQLNTLRAMVKEDPSAAAIGYKLAGRLADEEVHIRNRLWNKAVRGLNAEELKHYGLERLKGGGITFMHQAGPKAKELVDFVERRAFQTMYKMDGTLKRNFKHRFTKNLHLDLADKVTKNLEIWKREAADKTFNLEKKALADNLADEASLALMPYREEALTKYGRKGDISELVDEDDLTTALQMAMNNKGLNHWTATHASKGMAITEEAARRTGSHQIPAKYKRKTSTEEHTTREILGKGKYSDEDLMKLENATEFINDAEAAIKLSARSKGKLALNAIQKEAILFEGQLRGSRNRILAGVLKANQIIKKGLLLGSYSWIKNNYWSNIRQSFANSGLLGIYDTGNLLKFKDDIAKDIYDLSFGKGGRWTVKDGALVMETKRGVKPVVAFKSDETQEMINRGIIDAPNLDELKTRLDRVGKFMYDENTLKEIDQLKNLPENKAFDFLNEKMDAWFDMIKTEPMARYVEQIARARTYKRTLDLLQKESGKDLTKLFGKEASDNALKNEATKITNEVFFDYGKLNYFERAWVREFVPFYSFYKQNMFYQGKSLFQPGRSTRIGQMSRVTDGRYFGTEPLTEEQRKALPNYVRNANTWMWTDNEGNRKVMFSTSDPVGDMYNKLTKEFWFKGDYINQLNPMLNSAISQMVGKDFFSGQELDPEAIRTKDPSKKIRYMFSRGYSTQYVYNLLHEAIDKTQSLAYEDHVPSGKAIWEDVRSKKMVTDVEYISRIDNIMSWLGALANFPVQMTGQIEKYRRGQQTGLDLLTNLAGPVTTTTLPAGSLEFNIRRAQEEREAEARRDVDRRTRRAFETQR